MEDLYPFAFSFRKRLYCYQNSQHCTKAKRTERDALPASQLMELTQNTLKKQVTLENYHPISRNFRVRYCHQWQGLGLQEHSPLPQGTTLTWITRVELVQLPATGNYSAIDTETANWCGHLPKKNGLSLVEDKTWFDELSSGLKDF